MPIPKKKLFVCCDGTGRDSIREKNDYITNVARFARCLKSTASDGALQFVYYHEGVAMHNGEFQYREAATGQGIHGMIQDAYYFLSLNFSFDEDRHDAIHLVGFSGGAFAVRALACFIQQVGLLAKTRLALLPMIYTLWQKQDLERLDSHAKLWEAKGHLKRDVEIASCGVWDSVSAMFPASDLAFVNAAVPPILKNVFHALALHETRTAFPPILWNTETKTKTQINMKQCWFAGDHSDIGGGHPDSSLAMISLLWMVAQYKEFTDVGFNEVMILDCMTPLYLHWQEKAIINWDELSFFNKQEYLMQNHIYTKGIVHGPESFATALWHLPGQTNIAAREEYMNPRSLNNSVPPPSRNNAIVPKRDVDVYALNDDTVNTARVVPQKTFANDTTKPISNETQQLFDQSSYPCIHFTVRILMSERKQECHLLSRFSTVRYGDNIAWADVTGTRGYFEEPATEWESWMFRQWIKREEEIFSKEPGTSAGNDRFTHFLYPFRREGERPRKAFYSPLPRASSTDRSRSIKDANDMIAEGIEKGPDLSQSHSSAATSVSSGVKYYLDIDYEGYFPERFGRAGAGGLARRELQLGTFSLARRPTLQRKSS